MPKYDIPTLLALRQNAQAEVEKFRVQAQALGNIMPRQRKANLSALSERSANRSRNPSNISYRSQTGSSTSKQSLRLPSRQPNNPPRGALAQTDAGFARFLKQHSSPRHKRVTAGGRIVPMAPSTPPPKMNLLTNTQDTKDYGTLPRGERGPRGQKSPTKDTEKNTHASEISKPSSLPAEAIVDQVQLSHANSSLEQCIQAPTLFPSLSSTSVSPTMFLRPSASLSLGNQFLQSEQKCQEGLKLLPNWAIYGLGGDQLLPNANLRFSSQSTPALFISAPSQLQPAGSALTSEFSTGNSFLQMGAATSDTTPSGLDSFYPVFGATGYPLIGNQVPLLNQSIPFQCASQGGADLTTLQGATREYEALSTQLSRIDRYMAVHTWDLDPRSKKLMVEQRMSLVRELDAVRLYKEQLESLFGHVKSGHAGVGKKPGTESSADQPLPGAFTDNPASQFPRPSTSTVPATFLGPTPTATFQPVLPVNERFPTSFQWTNGIGSYPLDNGIGSGHLETDTELLYEPGTSHQEVTCNLASRPGRQIAQVSSTKSTDTENSYVGGEWVTPTKSAPRDIITRIYERIDEATRRGDPIYGLLRELAAVSTKLVRQASEERNGARHPEQNRNNRTRATNKTGLSGSEARETGRTIGRPWKSEDGGHSSANKMGLMPCEPGDDAGSWSTSSSTTNSWATIHEGGNRCGTNRQVLANEDNEENRDRLRKLALGHAAPTRSESANLRDAITLDCKVSTIDTTRESGSESTRHSGCQLLTQYFDKEASTGSRKSAPLAASQSVNAHAFLPPFDGASDSPGLSDGHQHSPCHQDNTRSRSEAVPKSNQAKGPWYVKEERAKPSPAVLREFFRRIEEEERNTIHRYQMTDPTPWQLG